MRYWSKSWTLIDGCTPVSEACDHCWLRSIDSRFGKEWNKVKALEHKLRVPMTVKKPTTWAIWSDLFHYDIPEEFILTAFEVMAACPQHTFLVLTKRPARISYVLYEYGAAPLLGGGDYIPNVWLGTTVEKGIYADRIDLLRRCYPHNLFLSVEPMLAPLADLNLEHIKLVICGCESGPRRRKTEIDWIRELRDQCIGQDVMFYLKRMDIGGKVVHLPELDGIKYDKLPWRI